MFIINSLVIGLSNEKEIYDDYMTLSIINLLSFQSTTWQACGISSLVDCLSKSNHSTNDRCGNHCNQNHNEEWQRHESRTTWCQFSINKFITQWLLGGTSYIMEHLFYYTIWSELVVNWVNCDCALITLSEWRAILNNYYVLKAFLVFLFSWP